MKSVLLLATLAYLAEAQLSNVTTPFLNVTAISAANGESTLECWQLANPFKETVESGITGALQLDMGPLGSASYAVIPPRFDGGFHHAPAFQYVMFISGLVHITLYEGSDEAWIQGGKYGLVIAADTANRTTHGHRTRYPSAADTIGLEIPIQNPECFKYTVLYSGACRETEMVGL